MKHPAIRWLAFGTLLLALSVIWHLPASVVARILPLPPALDIRLPLGSWHTGQALLYWRERPAGLVQWRWHPLALFAGEAAFSLRWRYLDNHASVEAAYNPLSKSATFRKLNGQIALMTLQPLLPPDLQALKPAGELTFANLNGRLSLAPPWPQRLSGLVKGDRLQLMGVAVRMPLQLQWRTENASEIVGELRGKDVHGTLRGTLKLTADRPAVRYRFDFSATQLPPPDWVSLLFQPAGERRWQIEGTWRP